MPHFLDSVPFSGIIRIRDMMYAVERPFRLDQGDVSFDAPDSVKQGMVRAIGRNRQGRSNRWGGCSVAARGLRRATCGRDPLSAESLSVLRP
jgi:hypothetical protein